jgi:hypothetical protein
VVVESQDIPNEVMFVWYSNWFFKISG